MPFRTRLLPLAALAAAGLTLAACSSGGGSSAASDSPAATNISTSSTASVGRGLQAQFESTVQSVLPSVVLIQTSTDLGSGVVFDSKGDIVTNDHVVGSAKTFTVGVTGSAHALTATLVGTYPADDLAVIRVSNASGLTPAKFADSSTVKVGQLVLAMGNPLGLQSSVTNGIVSAVGRTVTEPTGDGSPGATLPDTIQTSASINPGNSGGALVDLNGQVIGIPTLAATDQQIGGGAAPGIGFAISSNIAKDIAGQIVTHGTVVNSHRAALGVKVTDVTGANGKPLGAGIVSLTRGGPAAEAGLQPGDLITSVNGTAMPTAQALAEVLANLQPGQSVKVTVERSGSDSPTIQVILGALPG
jgi:S1-C subfamily serine protease